MQLAALLKYETRLKKLPETNTVARETKKAVSQDGYQGRETILGVADRRDDSGVLRWSDAFVLLKKPKRFFQEDDAETAEIATTLTPHDAEEEVVHPLEGRHYGIVSVVGGAGLASILYNFLPPY